MRKYKRLLVKAALAGAAIAAPVVSKAADLSLTDVTNAAAGAQGSFNYGGGIGLAALTVAIGVGFLMYGLSLRRRR